MSITRRLFLQNTAAAGVVVTTVATPAIASHHEENPELARIDREMTAAEAALDIALQAKADAYARFLAAMPDVPDDLVVPPHHMHYLRHSGEQERDCFDEVVPNPNKMSRLIVCSHAMEQQFSSLLRPCRGRPSTRVREIRRIYRMALDLEAAKKDARVSSGADEAWRAVYVERRRIYDLAFELVEHPARTIEGLACKVRMYERFALSEERPYAGGYAATFLSKDLKANVLALASQPVPS